MTDRFDEVGASAVLKGAASFQADAERVVRSIEKIQASTDALVKSSQRGWDQVRAGALTAVAGVTAATAAIVGGMGAAGIAIASIGAQFDQTMHQNAAVIGGTAEEMAALGDTISSVAGQSATGFNDIAKTAGDLVKAGLSVDVVMRDGLKAITDFNDALVGEGSLGTAATAVAGALNLFDLGVDKTREVVNAMTAATVTSAATISTVLTAFAQFAPTAREANLTLEQTNMLISLMGRNAIIGGRAGTALKVMFSQLMAPSKQALELMEKFKISLYDVNGNLVDTRTLIGRLQAVFGDETNALNKLSDAQRQQALATIFGTDGMRAAIVLAKEGVAGYDKLAAAFVHVNLAKMADEARNSLNPQLNIMKNLLTSIATLVSGQFIPTLTNAAKNVNYFLRTLDPKIPKAFGDAINAILTGQTAAPSFQNILGPMGKTVDEIVSLFLRVRSAITDHLVPSIIYLRDAFGGTNEGMRTSATLVKFLADTLVGLINGVATVFYWIGRFTTAIKESSSASLIFGTVLKIYVAASLVGLALGILKIATSMSGLTTNLAFGAVKIAASFALMTASWLLFVANFTVQAGVVVAKFAWIAGQAVIDAALAAGAWVVAAVPPTLAWLGFALFTVQYYAVIGAAAVASAATAAAAWVAGAAASLVAMAPLLLIIGVLIATAAVLAVAWANDWLGIRTYTETSIQAIINAGSTLIDLFTRGFNILLTRVLPIWQLLWTTAWSYISIFIQDIVKLIGDFAQYNVDSFNTIKSIVIDIWTSLWSVVQSYLGEIAKGISEILNLLFTWISSQLAAAGKYYYDVWQKIWSAIAELVAQAAKVISLVVTNILKWIGSAINTAGTAISNAWAAVWNALGTIVQKAIQEIGRLVQGLLNKLGGITIFGVNVGQIVSGAFGAIGDAWHTVTSEFSAGAGVAIDAFNDVSAVVKELMKGTLNLDDVFKGTALDLSKLFAAPNTMFWTKMIDQMKQKGEEIKQLWGILHPDLGPGGIGFPPPLGGDGGGGGGKKGKGAGGGGGGPSAAEQMDALKKQIEEITADIPGMTQELIDFLAELEKANPGRLAGMVQAIRDQTLLIGQMLVASQQILLARMELIGVEQRLAKLAAEEAVLAAQRALAEIAFQRQLLELRVQVAQIDMQLLPLKQAEASIDRQINDLQRENFALTKARAELEYAALPIRYQIADIEQQINKIVDQRLALTRREAEIREQLAGMAIDKEMRATQKALDAAWATMNVSDILKLEGQKDALTEQKTASDERLQTIHDEQEQTRLLDELKTISLQREKLNLEDLLAPYDQKIQMISREVELTNARNAITIAGLNAQKQAIEDLMAPLEAQRQAIQAQIDLVGYQETIEMAQFDRRKLDLDELTGKEKLRQAELNQTILLQQQAMTELVLQYAAALTASGAFTTGESFEVAKRMGFWNEEIGKIGEIASAFAHVSEEVEKLTQKIQAIPKDVTVHVNVVTTTSTASTGGGGGDMASYQHGGVVPGPVGAPQLAIVHGGERFLGVRHSTPMAVQQAQSRPLAPSSVSNATSTTNVTIHSPRAPTGTEAQLWSYQLRDIIEGTRR